jgi:DHA1 family tetracycline resistance protein-like MFS transporter
MQEISKRFRNQPLPVVLMTIFVDMLGYGILIPIVPQLLADPNSPFSLLPQGMSIDQGYILLGFLVGIYPFMQFLATPILGQLSDRYGRKKILAIALSGTSISYFGFAIGILTRNIPLLFASRAFDGLTGGNISVAQAAIADISTPDSRARNFGFIGAAFGLGLIIGPYLGGKLSDPNLVSWFNPATPFWFAAGLSLINVLSVLTFFPETLTTIRKKVNIEWLRSIKNIISAYGMKALRVPFVSSFLFQAGFSFFITFFSVYLIRKFNFTQGNVGDFFAYIGLWTVFSQVFVNSNVTKWFKEDVVLRVSLIALSIFIALFFAPKSNWGLLFIVPFFAMFIGLVQANLLSLISRTASPETQGQILGVNSSINTLAQSLPPILSGYVAALVTPEMPLIISSVTIFMAGVVFVLFYKPQTTK